MKTAIIYIVAALAIVLFTNTNIQSQNSVKTSGNTETIKVSGKCDMCKSRIEKAAKIKGVDNAVWNSRTRILSVTYQPAVTNLSLIGKKVALAGHDNDLAKADDKTYGALPACCKYR